MSPIQHLARFSPMLLIAAVIACSSCSGGEPTNPPQVEPVANVTVTPNPATVAVGATTPLSVALTDAAGQSLSGRTVTWSSSDNAKATVSGGVVSGVATGSVTITAQSEGQQGTTTVNVTAGGGGGGGGGGGTANLLAVSISTYIGGSAFEHARDVATDAAGNIYIVGGTMSPNFPTTAGVIQRAHNPGTPSASGIDPMDVFIMKLSPTGSLIWSTYLGGPDTDRAYAVEVDAAGNVYVAGRAGSNFPVTTGAFQTTFRGGQETTFYGPQDGFVCKINSTGTQIIYCSYFGTTDPQIIRDIAIDAAGNAYLASSTTQSGLPTAWFTGSVQPNRSGGVDGVVAKINATGTQVLWATYLGGTGDEGHGENSIRVDASGNVYFLQNAGSTGMPTPNGFDNSLGGGSDVYLAKIAPDGRSLIYATYIGGSGPEQVETHELALDGAGNAYVVAKTSSTDFPTTTGAFQRTYGGSGGSGTGAGTNYPGDGFVMKISPTGALVASTYLGGRFGDGPEGSAVDAQGNVYLTGATFSDNFPTTTGPYLGRSGGADVIVGKLRADFTGLHFSMKMGGSSNDAGRGAHLDAAGNFYLVGETGSTNWPALNALSSTSGGQADGLFVKLVPSP